jgi:hypothetical protein
MLLKVGFEFEFKMHTSPTQLKLEFEFIIKYYCRLEIFFFQLKFRLGSDT